MITTASFTALAAILGLALPTRTGAAGFAAAVTVLFTALVLVNAFVFGFVGPGIAENLLYFDGSLTSYIGYNLQISSQVFAIPLLAVALVFVFRLSR